MGKQIGIIDETGYLAYEGQGFDPLNEDQIKSIEESNKEDEEE